MAIQIIEVNVSPKEVIVGDPITVTIVAAEVTWDTIKNNYTDWEQIKTDLSNWQSVLNYH